MKTCPHRNLTQTSEATGCASACLVVDHLSGAPLRCWRSALVYRRLALRISSKAKGSEASKQRSSTAVTGKSTVARARAAATGANATTARGAASAVQSHRRSGGRELGKVRLTSNGSTKSGSSNFPRASTASRMTTQHRTRQMRRPRRPLRRRVSTRRVLTTRARLAVAAQAIRRTTRSCIA